ncbi:hypothetical protein PPTG_22975 [Phytophthora nicotianae INRA-310]|uniref:DDE-1 domain-containing protein n=1 Tax=Phytophthora nicotianae (strain INRA-310) TaxID=761204 RepID=W2Q8D7_PHYN3|nr:hypothetical protein PPTG_22975 [Phytophthora nicotianae INRA-310]ETN08804.1 hypothetical protein PPTG_22975 [Phytophthora nicotianae INRA-310]
MLILDSLKTYKMASVRYALQEECYTQVEFIPPPPPGVTGICQPMDISVMEAFKNTNVYYKYHIEHPFPSNPQEKGALLSQIVSEAWEAIPAQVIVNGFDKAGLIPTGPRDSGARFGFLLFRSAMRHLYVKNRN